MGVFDGLLRGLLGGSGLGNLTQKAMGIADKIINRPEGVDVGQALISQLPSIASGLGGLAKNFGGFIPGVGGLVSQLGGAVEGIADDYDKQQIEYNTQDAKRINDAVINKERAWPSSWKTWGDIPDKYKSWSGLIKLYEEIASKPNGGSAFIENLDRMSGPNVMWNGSSTGLGTLMSEINIEDGDIAEDDKNAIEEWIRKQPVASGNLNSQNNMLKHASNNMTFTPGSYNGLRGDFNTNPLTGQVMNDRNNSGYGGFRKFAVAPKRSDPADSMYGQHLASVGFKNRNTPQVLSDLQPAKFLKPSEKAKLKKTFKRNFIR